MIANLSEIIGFINGKINRIKDFIAANLLVKKWAFGITS
jgi:hypothetical protein